MSSEATGTEELVAAAKAPRGLPRETSLLTQLREQLECSICFSILQDPVTFISCLHTFCGACAVRWLQSDASDDTGSKCPTCRERVKSVKDDFKAKAMVEVYFKKHPEEKRPDEEIEEMREEYKPGQKIEFYVCDDSEDEDMDDVEGGAEIYFTDPRWAPCYWCGGSTPEELRDVSVEGMENYTCPEPLRPNDPNAPGNSDTRHTYRGHGFCEGCTSSFPLRDDVFRQTSTCAVCDKYSCHNVFSRCVRPLKRPEEWILRDNHVYFPVNDYGPVERDIIFAYFQEKNLSENTLPEIIVRWLRTVEPDNCFSIEYHGIQRRLDLDAVYLDYECTVELVRSHFQRWWSATKEAENVQDGREKCWYGLECRTKNHNFNHRDRLNHMCAPAPPPAGRRGR